MIMAHEDSEYFVFLRKIHSASDTLRNSVLTKPVKIVGGQRYKSQIVFLVLKC